MYINYVLILAWVGFSLFQIINIHTGPIFSGLPYYLIMHINKPVCGKNRVLDIRCLQERVGTCLAGPFKKK